jgi:hypothetical protein
MMKRAHDEKISRWEVSGPMIASALLPTAALYLFYLLHLYHPPLFLFATISDSPGKWSLDFATY